jgi:hypothetical protein
MAALKQTVALLLVQESTLDALTTAKISRDGHTHLDVVIAEIECAVRDSLPAIRSAAFHAKLQLDRLEQPPSPFPAA